MDKMGEENKIKIVYRLKLCVYTRVCVCVCVCGTDQQPCIPVAMGT